MEGPARIERVDRGQTGIGGGDDERTHALSDSGDDGDLARPRVGQEAELRALQDPTTLGALGGHGDVVQGPRPRMVGQGHGARDGARGDLRQEALALFGGADLPDHRCELGDGGQQGPRRNGSAQLLHDDGHLHKGEADATVLLGDGQGGPIERDHGAPELLGWLARLHHRTDELHGALLLEERTDRGAQLFLLGRELELHRPPFTALAGCRSDRRCTTAAPGRSGPSVPDAHVSLPWRVLPSRRSVFWEAGHREPPGGRRSEAQARAGDFGEPFHFGKRLSVSQWRTRRGARLCCTGQ